MKNLFGSLLPLLTLVALTTSPEASEVSPSPNYQSPNYSDFPNISTSPHQNTPDFFRTNSLIRKQDPSYQMKRPLKKHSLGLILGASPVQHSHSSNFNIDDTTSVGADIEDNPYFVGGIRYSYNFDSMTQAELIPSLEFEAFYLGTESEFDVDTGIGGISTSFDGDWNSTFVMGNIVLRKAYGAYTPYIGIGGGLAITDFSEVGLNANLAGVGATAVGNLEDDTVSPAVQFMLGSDYFINDRFSFLAEYKFLTTFGIDLEDEVGNTGVDLGIASDLSWHIFSLGFRVHM